jgi:hypothetical protein
MPDTSFVKDLFDILKSMILAVKVVDQYEGGLRFKGGVLRSKRLSDSNIRLREKILNDVYDTNMLDISIKKNQLESILADEREEMIKKGKLLKDKPGVVKKPHEVGRSDLFHTYNPSRRPNYDPKKFRKTGLFGKASHIDRYTNVLPAGTWWLIPEFWFGYMRVATLPINTQTMEVENITIPTTDEDSSKRSVSIGVNLTYIILDVEKAYLGPYQYASYLHTMAKIHLSELARNHPYSFWNGSSKVTPDFAKEIDKNVASDLIKSLFNKSEGEDGVWSYKESLVKSATRKSIDDLIKRSKEFYQVADDKTDVPLYRSNTSIISTKLKTALNFEMRNYGILVPTVQVIEGALTTQHRLLHTGNVVPEYMNISQAVENKKAGEE